MTNEEFKNQLKKLGINKREFAEKFGVSHSSVNNWSGKPIPGWVPAVIALMIELNECTAAAALGIKGDALDKEVAATIEKLEKDLIEKLEKDLIEKKEEQEKQLNELSQKITGEVHDLAKIIEKITGSQNL